MLLSAKKTVFVLLCLFVANPLRAAVGDDSSRRSSVPAASVETSRIIKEAAANSSSLSADSYPKTEFGESQSTLGQDGSNWSSTPVSGNLVAANTSPFPLDAGSPTGAEPDSATNAAVTGEPVAAATPDSASPSMWIWQDSNDTPVTVTLKQPHTRPAFNPLTDSGLGIKLAGSGNFGATSETQKGAARYGALDGGFSLGATGFVYNPQLASYQLSTSYDRGSVGFGGRDAVMNGLSYDARVYLLQATMLPFSVTVTRNREQTDGTLGTPFNFNSGSTELSGSVHQLPVTLAYHLATGSSNTDNTLGYSSKYSYRSGEVAIAKTWNDFKINVGDNYLRSETQFSNQPPLIDDRTQTTNYLHLNVDRNFGSRVTAFANGDLSSYKLAENQGTASTDANVSSLGSGANWHITPKLDATFSAQFMRNAVNVLALLSQSTATPLANPLLNVTVLNTLGRSFGSATSYRPSRNWNLGTAVNYNSTDLPSSLANSSQITNKTLSTSVSAGYTHRVWKFDYSGAGSVGVQSSAMTSGKSVLGKIYGLSNGITAGNENGLYWALRYSIDRTNNPVFFSILNTDNRVFDLDLMSRRIRFVRLSGKIEYSQRAIEYGGSKQQANGLNFLVTVTRSKLDVSAGRTTSDANQRFFGLVSTFLGGGGATGVVPPSLALTTPNIFSTSRNDLIMVNWRAQDKLLLQSRYTRFGFTVTGQNTQNTDTWFDNSAQYQFGRFDLVGGFVHAIGHTDNSDLNSNRLYFRVKFPFQIG